MQSLGNEFVVLSRHLGQAQQRCSAGLAAQATDIEALQAEIVRLRAAVMVRDTRLAMVHEALVVLETATASLTLQRALGRQAADMAEHRAAAVSSPKRAIRARMAAPRRNGDDMPSERPQFTIEPVREDGLGQEPSDPCLAAANLVVCQMGCISHGDYWRVQDRCRRTGETCVQVDHRPMAPPYEVLESLATEPRGLTTPAQSLHPLAKADAEK